MNEHNENEEYSEIYKLQLILLGVVMVMFSLMPLIMLIVKYLVH